MDPIELARTWRRRWKLVAGCSLLGLILGLVSLWSGPQPTAAAYYSATDTLVLRSGASMPRLANFVNDGEVPRRVANRLGGSPAALASLAQVTQRPREGLLDITTFDVDPDRAAALADTFADELVHFQNDLVERQRAAAVAPLDAAYKSQALELATAQTAADQAAARGQPVDHANLSALSNQVAALATKIRAANTQAFIDGGLSTVHASAPTAVSLQTVTDAVQSRFPTQRKKLPPTLEKLRAPPRAPLGTPLSRGAAGAAAGLLFGLVLTTIVERFDPRVRSRFDAERALGWPVFAEIPVLSRRQRRVARIMALDRPRSRSAEAVRRLRAAVLRPEVDGGGRVVMVTSPGPGEGKTTTVANLAVVLGETGLTVLVVDCDFRRPRVRAYLGRDDEVLPDPENDPLRHVAFTMLEADEMAKANPAKVLAAQHQLIAEARSSYDVILLDTAPLLTTNDAAELLDVADQVVVLARVGRTTKEAADLAGELLERRSAPPVIAALVGVTRASRSRVFGRGGQAGRGSASRPRHVVGAGVGVDPASPSPGPAGPSNGAGDPLPAELAGRRLTGTNVHQESSGSTVGLLASVLGVVVVALLLSKFTDATQPTVGAVVLLPVVVGASVLMIRRVPNVGSRDIRSVMYLGLMLRLIGSYIRFLIPADAKTYHDEGVRLAASLRTLNLNVDLGRDLIGTGFIRYLSGWVHVVVADDMSASFLVWTFFSFAGCFLLYQAFVLAVPGGNRYRYALVVFCWPSLAYWPDSIGKEGWMLLGIGVASYGAARVLTKQTASGLVILAIGLGACTLVRPHVALAMFLALSVALLIRRSVGPSRGVGLVVKVVGVVVLLVLGGFLANKTASVLSHDETVDVSSDTIASTTSTLDATTDQTSQGDSAFQASPVHSPIDLPKALVTVLFRPFPNEAHDINGLLTATESLVLLGLLIASYRQLLRLPKLMREIPYVTYAVVYTLVFVYAFSAIGNFGILARQRTQLTPLLLVLVALPAVSGRIRRDADGADELDLDPDPTPGDDGSVSLSSGPSGGAGDGRAPADDAVSSGTPSSARPAIADRGG